MTLPPSRCQNSERVAGLAASCYAQMNGYQSHLFEHHTVPGGVAAAWKRGGYLIDGGIHFLMGHRPGQPMYELYRELGAAPGRGGLPWCNKKGLPCIDSM